MAIVPAVVSAGTVDLRVLRGLRLMRLFRLSRYNRGLVTFLKVLRESQQQLVIALSVVVAVLLMASSLLHIVERDAQPETFGSIPAAMWWVVATLTTVGYGDVRPMTDLGRVLASVIAILGIGTFAMPAGIVASAFERCVRGERGEAGRCPECGAIRSGGTDGQPAAT
ncbi:MAG: ion transporter [Myxococcota bacterium]